MSFFNYKKGSKKGYMEREGFFYYGIHMKCAKMKTFILLMHLLVSSSDPGNLRVSEYDIKDSKCEKLLGVKFNNKLTFEKHITDICRKASRKTYALARITHHIDFSKRRMIMNAFFNSWFSYCQLIWMCHNRMIKRKINRLHERCLRIICNDKQSSIKMLLEKDSSASIHTRYI